MSSCLEDGETSPQKLSTLLRATDFKVRQGQRGGNAPPFLGLSVPHDDLPRVRGALSLLCGQLGIVHEELFGAYPYAVSWAICASLSEEYGGHDGHAVWPTVEAVFGTRLSQEGRLEVVEGFKRACRKLGLATDGFDRYVDLFLMHAGVSRGQLIHIARAFLSQHRTFGAPPAHDVVLLNRWEDDSMHFLPQGVEVPRRPILHDTSAWHAALYVEWLQDPAAFEAQTGVVGDFARALNAAKGEARSSSYNSAPPQPALLWSGGRVALRFPRTEGRIKIDVGNGPIRIRTEQPFPLPVPPPVEVSWWIADDRFTREVLGREADVAFFDLEDGRLCHLQRPVATSKVTISAPRVIAASRLPFSVDDKQAEAAGPSLFALELDLARRTAHFRSETSVFEMCAAQRSRISILGQAIGTGIAATPDLFGPDALLRIEPGTLVGQDLLLGVEFRGEGNSIPLTFGEERLAEISLEDALRSVALQIGEDPVWLDLVLLRVPLGEKTPVPTRIRRSLVFWRGYRGRRGNLLESSEAPRNLLDERLLHASRDDRGRIAVDRAGGFEAARLAFDLSGRIGEFSIKPEGLGLVHEAPDGSRTPLPLGVSRTFGPSDRAGAIVVRSPDRAAGLIVRGRHIDRPFQATGQWAVPVSELLASGPPTVVHRSSTGAEALLLTIESATQPVVFETHQRGDRTELVLEMPEGIGGIKIELEDELGAVWQAEASLDHFPLTKSRQPWLQVELVRPRAALIKVTAPEGAVGLQRADVAVRHVAQGEWSGLRNGRGDRYSIAVRPLNDANPDSVVTRVQRLTHWLEDCYAIEAWSGGLGDSLPRRWSRALQELVAQPGGISRLLVSVHDRRDESSWLPMKHPVEVIPDLYSAPSSEFWLLRTASHPAARALSLIATLNHGRLRANKELSSVAFAGFTNFHAAEKTGVPLVQFQPSRLMSILRALSPSVLDEWTGANVLGPEHLVSGNRLFRARCEDFGLFFTETSDGRMSERGARLNRVLRALAAETEEKAAFSQDDEVVTWANEALRTYAKASRQATTPALLARVAAASSLTQSNVLAALGELLRLAPELFSFHLICAELERIRT